MFSLPSLQTTWARKRECQKSMFEKVWFYAAQLFLLVHCYLCQLLAVTLVSLCPWRYLPRPSFPSILLVPSVILTILAQRFVIYSRSLAIISLRPSLCPSRILLPIYLVFFRHSLPEYYWTTSVDHLKSPGQ